MLYKMKLTYIKMLFHSCIYFLNYYTITENNSLPNMSSDTGIRRISPVNSQVVCLASIPDVPSNTWNIKECDWHKHNRSLSWLFIKSIRYKTYTFR